MSSQAETHAVRCFLRHVPDQQERYERISEHLAAVQLPQAVEFVLLEQGIRVAGQWRPILKMDWISGSTMTAWLDRNHAQPTLVGALLDCMGELEQDLAARSIGHGDLQHGNILVVDGRTGPSVRLIDYDGMWVPGLSGWKGSERGHANYQHPDRTTADFDPSVDSFSLWVIRTSLLAIRSDPRAWLRLRPLGADNHLLLRKADYLSPGASEAFRALHTASDPEVRSAADALRLLCPPSEAVLGLPRPGQGGTPRTPSHAARGTPDWVAAAHSEARVLARPKNAPGRDAERKPRRSVAGDTLRIVGFLIGGLIKLILVLALVALVVAAPLTFLGVLLPGQGVLTDAAAQAVGGVDGLALIVIVAIALAVVLTRMRARS